MNDPLHYAIPTLNFLLLLIVVWHLLKLHREVERKLPPLCIRTGEPACLLIRRPDLLCASCAARVSAAVREAHHAPA